LLIYILIIKSSYQHILLILVPGQKMVEPGTSKRTEKC